MNKNLYKQLRRGLRIGVGGKLGDMWWSFMLRGIFAVALGVFALFWPTLSLSILLLVAGIYCIADGIAGLIGAMRSTERLEFFVQALFSLAVSAVLVFWPGGSLRTLLIIFGAFVVFMGVSQIMAARQSERSDRIKAMLFLAESDLDFSYVDFYHDPYLLNMQNGTMDLRSGNLHPHRSSNFIRSII